MLEPSEYNWRNGSVALAMAPKVQTIAGIHYCASGTLPENT